MNSTLAEAKAKDRDLNYWKTRVATAEEKVKEWSARACEADERIAQAREILKGSLAETSHVSSWQDMEDEVNKALDALEGK